MPNIRTTDHAESYHGKQHLHYKKHAQLGEWIICFRELSHTEQMQAADIENGLQRVGNVAKKNKENSTKRLIRLQ